MFSSNMIKYNIAPIPDRKELIDNEIKRIEENLQLLKGAWIVLKELWRR